jgi:diguanylate cyclase (GGDEF)-like protein
MIDMDHFKEINDTLGHHEGDNALRDMASIIKNNIRHSDFAARYGGDEFIIAAKEDDSTEKIMEKIQRAVTAHNEKNQRPYKLRISYGVDTFTTNSGIAMQEFLTHIDSLMYKNKSSRRRRSDAEPAGEK